MLAGGHFEGADCISERGLFSSGTGGLVAVISYARSGLWGDFPLPVAFTDALYGYSSFFDEIGPYSFLGEAYVYAKAYCSMSNEPHQNLLGDPSMFVWRGDPVRLQVTASPASLTTGIQSVSITVRRPDGTAVPQAVVCLYKAGEVFATGMTNDRGVATFSNLPVSTPGSITVTATKRKTVAVNPDVVNFLPGTSTISVSQGSGPLVCLQGMTINDDETGMSHGNGDNRADLNETIELDIQVKNTGTTTATNVSATLSVVGGSGLILDQEDMTESLGSITAGSTVNRTAAFRLELDDHFESEEDPSVVLQITFTYNTTQTFVSQADFRVYDGRLVIKVAPTTLTPGSGQTSVALNNIYVVNPGLGALEDVQIQLTNPVPAATISGDLISWIGDIPGNTGFTSTDGISAVLAQTGWSGTFDLVLSDRWGTISTTTIDASDLATQAPGSAPVLMGSGNHSISVEWTAATGSTGYYLWTRPEGTLTWTRRNILPIPVLHGTASGLASGTPYDIAVTSVSSELQESPQTSAMSTMSTCLPSVSGWPVQLDGSTGSGPAVADMDLDGDYEVVAATSTGSLYIIEDTGGTPSPIGTRQPYIFTGVAVGDIYPSLGSSGGYGRPEVAASGWDITNSRAVVLVYIWSGSAWTLHQTIAALLEDRSASMRI